MWAPNGCTTAAGPQLIESKADLVPRGSSPPIVPRTAWAQPGAAVGVNISHMLGITVVLLAIPSPSSTPTQSLVAAAINSFGANINGHATTATKPTAEHVVDTSAMTPPSAMAHAHAAVAVATTKADATSLETAATTTPTCKLGPVRCAAQVGEFPDRVSAAIADGTCTQIKGGYKYTHTDDATYTSKGQRCDGKSGTIVFGGDLTLPHSSCGLGVDAVMNGTLTNCLYPHVGGLLRQEWLLGPYVSTGGNDYWDNDVDHTHLAVASSQHSSLAGWGVTIHDADTGEELRLPPLHKHHIGLFQGASGDARSAWVKEGSGGEYVEYRGYHDFYRHGYRIPLPQDLVANLLINDVRAADSPPIRWYANISFTHDDGAARRDDVVTHMDADETDSKHGTKVETLGLMKLETALVAASRFANFEVPKNTDSFYVQTGTWPTSGTMLFGNNDLTGTHTHHHLFQQSWLFAGTPAQLGLDDPTFGSATGCDPVKTKEQTRFASNGEMATYLQTRCPSCYSLTYSRTNPDAATRLLCQMHAHQAEVGGLWYDREMVPDCYANRIPFVKGQPFTHLVFMDGGKPTMPSYHALDWAAEGYASIHVAWYIRYVDADRTKVNELHSTMMLAENATFDENRCAGEPEWLQYVYPKR